MSFPLPQSDPGASQPFRIVLQQAEESSTEHFRPTAVLQITSVLRTSGLLRGLPAEEVKTLLLVLTYLTPNGVFLATVHQMAEAMRVSLGKMEQRLRRLQGFAWQGESILREQVRENGLRSYTPSTFLIAVEQARLQVPESIAPLPATSSREAVIERSRAAYAHPRAEVERQIAELNGWEVPGEVVEEGDTTNLRYRLLRFGVTPEQAEELLVQYPAEEIRQQLDWIPYRKARKPGLLLIAAIENHYDEPIVLRQRRLFEQALQAPFEPAATTKEQPQEQEVETPPSLVPLAEGETLILPPIPSSDGTPPES